MFFVLGVRACATSAHLQARGQREQCVVGAAGCQRGGILFVFARRREAEREAAPTSPAIFIHTLPSLTTPNAATATAAAATGAPRESSTIAWGSGCARVFLSAPRSALRASTGSLGRPGGAGVNGSAVGESLGSRAWRCHRNPKKTKFAVPDPLVFSFDVSLPSFSARPRCSSALSAQRHQAPTHHLPASLPHQCGAPPPCCCGARRPRRRLRALARSPRPRPRSVVCVVLVAVIKTNTNWGSGGKEPAVVRAWGGGGGREDTRARAHERTRPPSTQFPAASTSASSLLRRLGGVSVGLGLAAASAGCSPATGAAAAERAASTATGGGVVLSRAGVASPDPARTVVFVLGGAGVGQGHPGERVFWVVVFGEGVRERARENEQTLTPPHTHTSAPASPPTFPPSSTCPRATCCAPTSSLARRRATPSPP